jgi:hypothetical protein
MPTLADAGYTTLFTRDGASIYDDYSTINTANQPPVLKAPRYKLTGLWKLPLQTIETPATTDNKPPQNEAINVIFDLPSACQTFLWYHAAARFPVKETSIKAVRHGNYATWP